MSKRKQRKDINYFGENTSEALECQILKKPYHKIKLHEKLQIISAIEKGQTKIDIAREFQIHPSTVTVIYRQKHDVLKQCKHKKCTINSECSINLNQCILNWFTQQLNSNRPVIRRDIKNKVEKISHSINKKGFKFNKDWFTRFRICNNIIKHKGVTEGAPTKEDCASWSNITENFDEDDIYIGGTCSLLYMANLQNFITKELNLDNFVSVLLLTNVSGLDKHKLLVVGNGICQTDMQSLPLQYFHKKSATFDNFIISNLLLNWDYELKQKNRKILLAFHVPDSYVDSLHLEQIKILNCTNIPYIVKTFTKIVNCFKYHYRKLQIMQTFSYRKNEVDFMDYVRMLSLAWHSVSSRTVHNIFHPRFSGCYYFNNLEKHNSDNEENERFSLSEWCITHGIPLKLELDVVDHFISCDNELASLDQFLRKPNYTNVNDWLSQGNGFPTTSAIEAFQAAKRLLRYTQTESGTLEIYNSVKFLEDQFEVEACIEVQQSFHTQRTNYMDN